MSGKRKRPSPNEEIIGKLDNTPISRQAFIDYADYRQRKFGRNDPFPGRDQWNFQFDNNLANFDLKKDLNSTFGEQYVLARQRYYNQGRIPVPGGAYVTPPSQQEVAKGQNRTAVPQSSTTAAPSSDASPSSSDAKPTNEEAPLRTAPYSSESNITVTAFKKQKFDISSFRAEINKNDVQPTHSYLVTFAPFRLGSEANVPLTEFVRYNSDKLILRCESVVLPTVQLLEEENIRRYGYGPVEKVPYGMQFNDLTLTWLVDKRSELIDFFYQWMNTIVNYETRGISQLVVESDRPGLNSYLGYEVGYKDEYTCPVVRVRVYDRELNTVTEYILYDVFPMNIQSQNLAYSQENEAQKLTITFAFTNMQTLTPRALNGRLEAELEAQATADAKAAAAEKENKKKNNKDYSRRVGQNPQSSVNASTPNATNNNPPKSTNPTDSTETTTTRNLSGTRIGPPA